MVFDSTNPSPLNGIDIIWDAFILNIKPLDSFRNMLFCNGVVVGKTLFELIYVPGSLICVVLPAGATPKAIRSQSVKISRNLELTWSALQGLCKSSLTYFAVKLASSDGIAV